MLINNKKDGLFPHLKLTQDDRRGYFIRNLFLDWFFNQDNKQLSDIVKDFLERCPSYKEYYQKWNQLPKNAIEEIINKYKQQSVFYVSIMLTGNCNCDCSYCYSDRKKKDNELKWPQIKNILDQARNLGAKSIYVAGEGEPLLDPSFLDILRYGKYYSMPITIYTNGLVFSNKSESKKIFGVDCREALELIAKFPVYFYFKFWSSKPDLFCNLLGTDSFSFVKVRLSDMNFYIPQGIELAQEVLGSSRTGIQVMIVNENYEDVCNNIFPYINKRQLAYHIDECVPAGRASNLRQPLDESKKELISSYLTFNCQFRQSWQLLVTNTGHLTSGLAIPEDRDEYLVWYKDGSIKDLFILRHTLPQLIEYRYLLKDCLCHFWWTKKNQDNRRKNA